MKVDASIGHEWRDRNIEKSFEPGLGFARRHRSRRLQPRDAFRSAYPQNPSNTVAKCLKTTPCSDFQPESQLLHGGDDHATISVQLFILYPTSASIHSFEASINPAVEQRRAQRGTAAWERRMTEQ
jgi:hypothetical protein